MESLGYTYIKNKSGALTPLKDDGYALPHMSDQKLVPVSDENGSKTRGRRLHFLTLLSVALHTGVRLLLPALQGY